MAFRDGWGQEDEVRGKGFPQETGKEQNGLLGNSAQGLAKGIAKVNTGTDLQHRSPH